MTVDQKAALISQVFDHLHKQYKNPEHTENLHLFIHKFFERIPTLTLQKLTFDDLVIYVSFSWEIFVHRPQENALIKEKLCTVSTHRSPRWFLAILNTDRPYIVYSLQAFLNAAVIKHQLLVHPVIFVERDKKGHLKKIHNHNISHSESPDIRGESLVFMQLTFNGSAEQRQQLLSQLETMFHYLSWVVDDQPEIEKRLHLLQDHLSKTQIKQWSPDQVMDGVQFLEWLNNQNFAFLGMRYFAGEVDPSNDNFFCLGESSQNIGLFRSEAFSNDDNLVPGFARAKIVADHHVTPSDTYPLVTVIKTNRRSPILRSSRIDAIEVLDWSEDGKIKGVLQCIGVFNKSIFTTSAFEIPVLSRKVRNVFERFNVNPTWYDGQSLTEIIDSIPRDEMFYHTEDQLAHICERVLQIQDQGGLAVFPRPDEYGRYLTIMIYLPRERYSFDLRDKFASILSQFFHCKITSNVVQLGDLPFARIIYVLSFEDPQRIEIHLHELQHALQEASLNWEDQLEKYIDSESDDTRSAPLSHSYRRFFSRSYQEQFTIQEAFQDIYYLEALSPAYPVDLNLYEAKNGGLRAKIYHRGPALSLAILLPILSNLGLRVKAETTFAAKREGAVFHVHDFEIDIDPSIPWKENAVFLRAAFNEIWQSGVENDGFNQLVLLCALSIRQVCLLRAYAKYLLQIKLPYSQRYIETTLAQYPEISRSFLELFEARFRPNRADLPSQTELEEKIINQLQSVERLDHDRILRRLLNAISCTLRTNYYQLDKEGRNKDYISLKFDSTGLDEIPQPSPLYEVYVYSARVEAIHLRGGKVARGGIRWSDRMEDYRTEILGLMKAQMVKNSVIVPLGSKGGFIVKKHADFPNRADLMKEVVACYQTLMRGLLDITDNLVGGQLVPPTQVICYDENDPYLVVAADKGTATFSDIANAISQEYNFWLDDAFASGGSAGYDHKKMAITSRGAWESVKRHFRELGHNVDAQPFTVIGVGDMSGDVFGNGMLRSNKTCLIAAFDHRHIFIDPTPDPLTSFEERKRVSELPRSSWMDYNTALLSKGGNIYDRSQKTLQLTPEIMALLGVTTATITPDELILKILKTPADLLWFGGIGTFVKASTESHADVGDATNNATRVDARDLCVKVIGEGANLGMTQLGRVEYALKGGKINTDAIDNSAGVDCSDHEVNIKILFNALSTPIDRTKRDQILKEMTDNVAELVLRDNYEQTQILSILNNYGREGLSRFQALIKILEVEANLDRTIEFLPDDEELERRRSHNQGFTRPELAIILAYAKNSLYSKLLEYEDIRGDGLYHPYLTNYFPTYIQQNFAQGIMQHPLRREIIVTVLVNKIINQVGPYFVYELSQASGRPYVDVVEAYFIAIDLLDLEHIRQDIETLDNMMLSDVQIQLYLQMATMLKAAILRIIQHGIGRPISKETVAKVVAHLSSLIEGDHQDDLQNKIKDYKELGIDDKKATLFATIPYLNMAIDIAIVSPDQSMVTHTAKAFFMIRAQFGLDWLYNQTLHLKVEADWQRSAQLTLIDDISHTLSGLTKEVIQFCENQPADRWLEEHQEYLQLAQHLLDPLKAIEAPDCGLLGYAIRKLQRFRRGSIASQGVIPAGES